jgi:hypothetical protein
MDYKKRQRLDKAISLVNAHIMDQVLLLTQNEMSFDAALYDGDQVLTPRMMVEELNSAHVKRYLFIRFGIQGIHAYFENGEIHFRASDQGDFFEEHPELLTQALLKQDPWYFCKIYLSCHCCEEDQVMPRRFTVKAHANSTVPKGLMLYLSRMFDTAWPCAKYVVCNKSGFPSDDDIIWAVMHRLSFGRLV